MRPLLIFPTPLYRRVLRAHVHRLQHAGVRDAKDIADIVGGVEAAVAGVVPRTPDVDNAVAGAGKQEGVVCIEAQAEHAPPVTFDDGFALERAQAVDEDFASLRAGVDVFIAEHYGENGAGVSKAVGEDGELLVLPVADVLAGLAGEDVRGGGQDVGVIIEDGVVWARGGARWRVAACQTVSVA